MKDREELNEELTDELDELTGEHGGSLFEVHRARHATIYEASKNVDWMSLFPDEAGRSDASGRREADSGPPKLIDLPLQVLAPTESNGPPDRPTKVYYPRAIEPLAIERTPKFVIAASLISVLAVAGLLYWLVTPSTIGRRDRSDDRLTVDALAPAIEGPAASPASEPAPSTAIPVPPLRTSATPAETPAKRAAATPGSTVTPGRIASSRAATAPRVTPTPRPTAPPRATARATPTVTPRATPVVTQQARPEPTLQQSQPPAFVPPPALTVVPTPGVSASGSATPPSLGAPPPRTVSSPQPSATPTPSPTPRLSTTPLPSPSPTSATASTSAPPAASPPVSTSRSSAAETAAVRAVLDTYRAAYESLRAESVKAVWPGANTQALAKAFSQIAAQNMDFYSCGIEFNAAGAEATCVGQVTFVPKVGGKTPRVESRGWSFYLVRQNDRWVINRVVAR